MLWPHEAPKNGKSYSTEQANLVPFSFDQPNPFIMDPTAAALHPRFATRRNPTTNVSETRVMGPYPSMWLDSSSHGEPWIPEMRVFTPQEKFDRYPRAGLELHRDELENFFGTKAIEDFKNKRILVPYLGSMGHGHMHQALDMSEYITQVLGAQAVFVDPQHIQPEEGQFYTKTKALLMHMIHNNTINEEEIKKQMATYMLPSQQPNRVLEEVKMGMAEWLIMKAMGSLVHEKAEADRLTNLVTHNPLAARIVFTMFAHADRTLSEKVLAETTYHLAKSVDADGIISTFSGIHRADPALRRQIMGDKPFAEITAIPDPGYTEVLLPNERNEKTTDHLAEGQILEQFAGPQNGPILYGVGSETVAERLHQYFGIPENKIFPVGTIADSITPEQFNNKWRQAERKILMPISGNAHNLPFITQAIEETFSEHKNIQWMKDNHLKFTVYFADRGDMATEFVNHITAKCLGSHWSEFVDIAYADSKAAASELKQILQRSHHIEWRSPGENILTGADVGTCEVGLATKGTERSVNEIYNMKYMSSMPQGYGAIPSSWPASSFNFWAANGYKPDQYGLNTAPFHSFKDMVSDLMSTDTNGRSKAENIALSGYLQANHESNFALTAMFVFDYLKPKNKTIDELKQFILDATHKHEEYKRAHLTMLGYLNPDGSVKEYAPKTRGERVHIAHELKSHPQLSSIIDYYLRQDELTEDEKIVLERKLIELSGFSTLKDFLAAVKKDTVVVTALAGAGSRWIESIHKSGNQQIVTDRHIDPEAPRCLTRVKDVLHPEEHKRNPYTAIGVYNLKAMEGLGQQVVMYGGETDRDANRNRMEIIRDVLLPAGVSARFSRQHIYPHNKKPSGHGDILMQLFADSEMADVLKDKKYVIANFGGDANSFRTATLSLLSMYVFNKYGHSVGSFIPTATVPGEGVIPYPLYLDEDSFLPVDTINPKDDGPDYKPEGIASRFSNVGVRLYSISDLRFAMSHYQLVQQHLASGGTYVDYPRATTKEDGTYVEGELKQDDFDRIIMRMAGRIALIGPFAHMIQIAHTPKNVEELEAFEADIVQVVADDQAFRKRHGLV